LSRFLRLFFPFRNFFYFFPEGFPPSHSPLSLSPMSIFQIFPFGFLFPGMRFFPFRFSLSFSPTPLVYLVSPVLFCDFLYSFHAFGLTPSLISLFFWFSFLLLMCLYGLSPRVDFLVFELTGPWFASLKFLLLPHRDFTYPSLMSAIHIMIAFFGPIRSHFSPFHALPRRPMEAFPPRPPSQLKTPSGFLFWTSCEASPSSLFWRTGAPLFFSLPPADPLSFAYASIFPLSLAFE